MHDPWKWTESEQALLMREARAGTLDPDTVIDLCRSLARLQADYHELSQQLQIESESRQAAMWERNYWVDLFRFRMREA